MSTLVYTIASTKRKLKEASEALDEVYRIQNETLKIKRQQLEKQYRNLDKEKIVLKITSRMVYLNKLPKTSITDSKIDELARLLDWIEEEE